MLRSVERDVFRTLVPISLVVDDGSHTTIISDYSGVGIDSQYQYVAVLYTNSPQTSVLESDSQCMVISGIADEPSYSMRSLERGKDLAPKRHFHVTVYNIN